MKRKNRKYLLLGVLFLAYTCSYSELTHMDEKDLKSFNVYNINDVRVFRSLESNQMDTMIVLKKNINNSLWPFMRDESTTEYHANCYILFKIKHKGESIKGSYYIEKYEQKCSLDFLFVLGNRYCLEKEKSKKTEDVVFKQMRLRLCYVINDSNSELGRIEAKDTVSEFIWQKEKGLVYYELNNNEKYLLKEIYDSLYNKK